MDVPRRRKPRQLPMATISAAEFDQYRRRVPALTKAGVMATYHISQHSWYKLRDGKPVKEAVVARLRRRFAILTEGERYGDTTEAAKGSSHIMGS